MGAERGLVKRCGEAARTPTANRSLVDSNRVFLGMPLMHNATIFVFEKKARWRPELQRRFEGRQVFVVAGSSIAALRESALQLRAERRSAIAIFDLSTSLTQVLQFLDQAPEWGDCLPTVCIGNESHDLLEPTLRELGAVVFHRLPLEGHRLADECERLLNAQSLI